VSSYWQSLLTQLAGQTPWAFVATLMIVKLSDLAELWIVRTANSDMFVVKRRHMIRRGRADPTNVQARNPRRLRSVNKPEPDSGPAARSG